MTPRITPIPFPVERQSPMIDGAGTPWVAFQAERGDSKNTKYTRIEKRTAAGWEHVPCPDAEQIYDQPMWGFHVDGSAVVTGMDAEKKHWIAADVPGYVPGVSVKAFQAMAADITRLTIQLANALDRIEKLEAR